MCLFYTTTTTAIEFIHPNAAEIERQSEEGADTDQLGEEDGRRLAAEVFAVACYFRGNLMATEKGNNDSRSGEAEADVEGEKSPSFNTFPGENVT